MISTTHTGAVALNDLMHQRALSQHAVSQACRDKGFPVSQGNISDILAGKKGFGLDSARAMAAVFAVPAAVFLPELAEMMAATDPTNIRVPLAGLGLSPKNERTSFDELDLFALAEDIAERGLLQNLLAYPEGALHLVADGGRRWRALRLLATQGRLPAELATLGIPVRLVKDEAEALVVTIVANMRREDVHFLDRARAFARLRDELGWDANRIGATINLVPDAVRQYWRIHDKLSEADRSLAMAGGLNFKEARERVAERKPAAEPQPLPPPLPLALPEVETPRPTGTDYLSAATAKRADEEPVSERVKRVLRAELLMSEGRPISAADRVTEDLGIDMMDADETRIALDEEFGIHIGPADFAKLGTVGELTRHVIALMAGPVPAVTPPPGRMPPVGVLWERGWVLHQVVVFEGRVERIVLIDRAGRVTKAFVAASHQPEAEPSSATTGE